MMRRFHVPRGLTLIELLIVIFIMVLFVAVAAPLFRPATADRKVREASRQINAFMHEAKAAAAQKARVVGIALDRASALDEGARDSNIVTRLYLAEVPPVYSGDVTNAQVALWQTPPPQQAPPNYPVPPPINVGGTNNRARMLDLDFRYNSPPGPNNAAMLDVIAASYLRNPLPSQWVPFTIRFNRRGSVYAGCAMYHPSPPYSPGPPGGLPGIRTRTWHYFCWAPFGSQVYNMTIPFLPPSPYPTPPPPSPIPPFATYEIWFPPQISSDSVLELPTGTVIDLQFSGYGQNGVDQFTAPSPPWDGKGFFDPTRSFEQPIVVLFTPGGDVAGVQNGARWEIPPGRIHFLVGTAERAIDSIDATVPDVRDLVTSNLMDPANQWVSLSTRTGHITTSDNLTPTDLSSVQAAVTQARAFATSLNTKGGR